MDFLITITHLFSVNNNGEDARLRHFLFLLPEATDEIVLRDNLYSKLLSFLVLSRSGCDVIINKVCCRLTHASRNLAALRFDVGFQLVAVLVMVHITRYDKRHAITFDALRLLLRLTDVYHFEQSGDGIHVARILKPVDERSRLLRSDARNVGEIIVSFRRGSKRDKLF